MSIFSGRQYKGAMRDARAAKRTEAEARDQESRHLPMGRRVLTGELDRAVYDPDGYRRPQPAIESIAMVRRGMSR